MFVVKVSRFFTRRLKNLKIGSKARKTSGNFIQKSRDRKFLFRDVRESHYDKGKIIFFQKFVPFLIPRLGSKNIFHEILDPIFPQDEIPIGEIPLLITLEFISIDFHGFVTRFDP